MTWAVPALAGAIGLAFSAVVARQWHAKRRPQDLAWTVGLAAYGAASLIEAWVAVHGWTTPLYRAYFPLAASLVGLLGLGTVYLAAKEPRWGHAFLAFVLAATAVAAGAQLLTPFAPDAPFTATVEGVEITQPADAWGEDLGAKAVPFSNPARVASLLLNVVGGLVLVAGAVAAFARTRRTGVLLIGLGALLPFAGGSLSTLGALNARITLQLAGIVVMFAGFLAASRAVRARDASSSEALP